jgi:hypothetical protein
MEHFLGSLPVCPYQVDLRHSELGPYNSGTASFWLTETSLGPILHKLPVNVEM